MTKNRYITGYSGLRALAVIGVILYHFDPNTFVGGYLGVPIFFVLSGYLVTCQILKAYDENGFYNTKKFYWSRIKKIYPPLIAVLWISAAYIVLFQQNLLAKLSQIVVANLLNIYNFWQILNGQSYFERFAASESPFVHLWTMSINGQFYILWPLVIFLLVKYGKKRKNIFSILLILSILSAIEMAIMFKTDVNINRIYYGTDTRFFSLGLGAALAVVWPLNKLKRNIKHNYYLLLDIFGLISFCGIIILFLSPIMNAEKAFTYLGGMFLFTLFTTILVGVTAHPGSHWNKWLTNPIFNWIGSRSYEIYLYQFPIMIFFEDKVSNMADHVLLYRFIELILIVISSELAYRVVEQPFGKISLQKAKKYLQQLRDKKSKNYFQKVWAILIGLIFLTGSIAILISPAAQAQNFNQSQLARRIRANRKQQRKDNNALIKEYQKISPREQKKAKLIKEAKQAAKKHPIKKSFEKFGISQIEIQLARKIDLTAIGDSVMAGSSNDLKDLLPKAVIDAAISRQLNVSFDLLKHYQNENVLGKNVLIGLGTNGPFKMSDIDDLMKQLGHKRQVFWINTYVPAKPWQNDVNNLLNEAAKKYHNFMVINWYSYAKNHPNWFYEDKTHPTPIGSKHYSALIVKEIVENAMY
ncbi:acyltransferase family protein [Lactobacillus sp. M0396]|uniref:acyltransferase family protein n=1 Tax=Lactobacillus sp. M0396 TaxID=2751030 RepID=UPI0018DDD8B8|nr:acyltransferase family protein [Lactobacillus sp. M0396]MBI0032345.1 acetyltransferase [Lactobacillus sp. M0396]